MTYYISGAISNGGTQENNFEGFNEAEARLKAKGLEVINPARMQDPEIEKFNDPVEKWVRYMARDLQILAYKRPKMYFLKGWEQSKGARLEMAWARVLGLEIEYEL